MYHDVPVTSASFAGHESFSLRFAWLKKGFDQLDENSQFFGDDQAMVTLGVGKNMVRSIRHWGLACQMWEERPQTRGRELEATPIGQTILGEEGDPFLEDVGTIWLLHWLLVTNGSRATTWAWTFGRPKANRFTREQLFSELRGVVRELQLARVPDSTLKRDVAVMLRSYCRPRLSGGVVGEDALDSPFVLLNLVRDGSERGSYEIVQGHHPSLPTGVLEFALVDYISRLRDRGGQAITLDELLYGALSPGRTFRLSEESLAHRLSDLVATNPRRYIFDETAGLRQLLVHGELPSREDVLNAYYEGAR